MKADLPLQEHLLPEPEISAGKAVLVGFLFAGVPALLIMVLLILTTFRQVGVFLACLVAIVLGWTWWSFTVPLWRQWAQKHGAPSEQTQRLAVVTGLVWPKGWIFEKSEYNWEKSSPVRIMLALLPAFAALSLLGLMGLANKSSPATDLTKGWREFSSESGKYAVMLPGDAKEEILTRDTEYGAVNVNAVKIELNQVTYMAMYTDLPDASLQVTPEEFLEQHRAGVIANIERDSNQKVEEVSHSTLSLAGYPGSELVLKAQAYTSKMRTYLVGKRQYVLTVAGLESKVTPEDATRFLASFRLKP